MIQQLIRRIVASGQTPAAASATVLAADPMDLVLHMEQVWDTFDAALPNPRARSRLWGTGVFNAFPPPATDPGWDHLGYAMVLENTRGVQIMRRVVREFRSGEGLGVPSRATQRWLDATEALLFQAPNPFPAWLSTSTARQDPEGVRRNAYWRMFGMDLAFGGDDNRPFVYDKATAANTSFVPLFEELLVELWQAISNISNVSGVNQSDDDRIYRLAEQLNFILGSRRLDRMLFREELAATMALGWMELSLITDTPVVVDLRAQATSPADRLRIIGERVGLAPHSRAGSFFSMADDLSVLLRMLESNVITGPANAAILYGPVAPAIGPRSRRVITEWSAATDKDLKLRAPPLRVDAPTG